MGLKCVTEIELVLGSHLSPLAGSHLWEWGLFGQSGGLCRETGAHWVVTAPRLDCFGGIPEQCSSRCSVG